MKLNPKVIKVTYSQSVRQSANYQSAEATVGVELEVNSSKPGAFEEATKIARAMVNSALATDVAAQRKKLQALSSE